MRKKPETTHKCDKCHAVREARAYYRKINGKWINLCSVCWDYEEYKLSDKTTEVSK